MGCIGSPLNRRKTAFASVNNSQVRLVRRQLKQLELTAVTATPYGDQPSRGAGKILMNKVILSSSTSGLSDFNDPL